MTVLLDACFCIGSSACVTFLFSTDVRMLMGVLGVETVEVHDSPFVSLWSIYVSKSLCPQAPQSQTQMALRLEMTLAILEV